MEQRREREAPLCGVGSSWAVTSPPTSLSQSALLFGVPVLYHQSSISSLLFVGNPERPHHRSDDSAVGSCRNNFLSIPTQLLMPDGGVALGMPPSPLITGSGPATATGTGRNGGAESEESRMSALRTGELAVILSESTESQVRSRRSRLLLLLAILLSLQYISLVAILQGNDTPPIFSLKKELLKRRIWHDVRDHEQVVAVAGSYHSYCGALRHNFYIVALSLCLILPLLLFSAVIERKRHMEATQSRNSQRGSAAARPVCPSFVPSVALSVAVIVFTCLTLIHGIFILRTYFDIMVLLLLFAIRYTLNRLNFVCFSSHLLLTKAASNM